MKKLGLGLFVVALAFGIQSTQAAETKDLIGSWVVEKSGGDPPKGTIVEFLKDGKMKITVEQEGKKISIDGTYKLEKEALEVVIKEPGGKEDKETLTVKEVTKDKLVIVTKDKKEIEFKKQ